MIRRVYMTPTFLRSKTTLRGLLQRLHELVPAEWTTCMRASPQCGNFPFRFARGQIILPAFPWPVLIPKGHIQTRIQLPAAMRSGARPRPRFCSLYQARANWIPFRVPQGYPQMVAVQRARVKPPLPDVAAGAMRRIPVARVPAMCLLQRLRQRVGLVRNDDQMHVAGHQAVAQEL